MIPQTERLEERDGLGRGIHLLCIESAAVLTRLELATPRFACFLVWDSASAPTEDVCHVASAILDAGAVYVCVWGTGCERVHAILDETVVGSDPRDDPETIMTTDHAGETLYEALWFALFCTYPVPELAESCKSNVVIVIGNSDYEATVRASLLDVAAFSRHRADDQVRS